MAWKLSVVAFLPNLQRGTDYHTITSSTVAAAQAVIPISGTEAPRYWLKGDVIKIGPSTNSANRSRFEYKKVLTTSATQITVDSNLAYAYGSGDPVNGVGSGLPQGWRYLAQGGDGLVSVLGFRSKAGLDGASYGGYLNNTHALWFNVTKGSVIGNSVVMDVKEQFFYPSMTVNGPDIQYRSGVYYWMTGATGSATLEFGRNNSVNDIGVSFLTTTLDQWVKGEGVNQIEALASGHWYRIFFPATLSVSGRFGIGLIYLTHASLTSAEASGVYSFPVNPVSVTELIEDRVTVVRTVARTIQANNFEVSNARGYRLRFVDVNEAMLRQLEVLQYWQDQNNLLMLESDITGDRPVFGFMDYSYSFSSWDTTKAELDFRFRGI